MTHPITQSIIQEIIKKATSRDLHYMVIYLNELEGFEAFGDYRIYSMDVLDETFQWLSHSEFLERLYPNFDLKMEWFGKDFQGDIYSTTWETHLERLEEIREELVNTLYKRASDKLDGWDFSFNEEVVCLIEMLKIAVEFDY